MTLIINYPTGGFLSGYKWVPSTTFPTDFAAIASLNPSRPWAQLLPSNGGRLASLGA